MRSMELVAPGSFQRVDREPPTPGPHQVLVRTEVCGLCASELDIFLGRNPWQQFPARLGHEGAGRVIASGRYVTACKEGDLVAAAQAGGCYADYFLVDEPAVLAIPTGLRARHALAEPLSCAVSSFDLIRARPNDTVVVLGAGFMALALVQLLRGAGLRRLLVAARRSEARALAERLGATDSCAPDAVQSTVAELTDGRGSDVVIEATGSEEMLTIAASLLRPEGTLAIVGYHQGDGRRVPIHEWNWKALRIANCHFRSQDRIVDGARRGLALAGRGVLNLQEMVTHSYPLSHIQEAFESAASRSPGFVKAVIVRD